MCTPPDNGLSDDKQEGVTSRFYRPGPVTIAPTDRTLRTITAPVDLRARAADLQRCPKLAHKSTDNWQPGDQMNQRS